MKQSGSQLSFHSTAAHRTRRCGCKPGQAEDDSRSVFDAVSYVRLSRYPDNVLPSPHRKGLRACIYEKRWLTSAGLLLQKQLQLVIVLLALQLSMA
ncbi:hypothetical protein L226DRAFT_531230 [Lentinus tigrinus ALCF2SS1-7]|uniref:uncharacterized protein n=1 Tax=Lentinus tigrinus ALCF2SS1-7 TaxID=1328758 RepID=UPI0011663C3E|nr:hypothetical protein L226DRAFT_531230 [Lentinus tigrinus ALCF2SS1-7]